MSAPSPLHPFQNRSPHQRRLMVWGAVALVIVVVCALVAVGVVARLSGSETGRAEVLAPSADGARHGTSGKRVCGTRGLRGPLTPPSGAVRVAVGQNVADVVDNAGPGTTFWLARGTHRLGTGEYDQIRPKNGDRFTGAPGAVFDGQHRNLYAFAGDATGVRIEHLTIQNFGSPGDNQNEGVVNHDGAHGWVIRHNTIRRNAGAGILVGSDNRITSNCLTGNGQYAINAYEENGVRNVSLVRNEISHNNADNWEKRDPGCGCSGGGKFWATTNATIVGNWVHDNRGVGLWADTNNTGFLVQGNTFDRNSDVGFMYETSYNARIVHNVFRRNAIAGGRANPGFPTSAIYLSESGGDKRAGQRFAGQMLISRNTFVDNWSAIAAWENADRFAGSPNNSSTGTTTLVNPGVATESACGNQTAIKGQPYNSDCRWKTQNLRVLHNRFSFSPSRVGHGCTAERGCGYVALVSNYGTDPDWSPYQGTVVEDHITFSQNNLWAHNRYVGPWRFMIHELGHDVSWKSWRSSPFKQDQGSSLRR